MDQEEVFTLPEPQTEGMPDEPRTAIHRRIQQGLALEVTAPGLEEVKTDVKSTLDGVAELKEQADGTASKLDSVTTDLANARADIKGLDDKTTKKLDDVQAQMGQVGAIPGIIGNVSTTLETIKSDVARVQSSIDKLPPPDAQIGKNVELILQHLGKLPVGTVEDPELPTELSDSMKVPLRALNSSEDNILATDQDLAKTNKALAALRAGKATPYFADAGLGDAWTAVTEPLPSDDPRLRAERWSQITNLRRRLLRGAAS